MGRKAPQLHPCDTQVSSREHTLEPLGPWWADVGPCSHHSQHHLRSRSRSCLSPSAPSPLTAPLPPFHPLRWFRNFAVTLGRATSPRSTGPCNKTPQSQLGWGFPLPPSQAVGLSVHLTSICFMSSVLQIQVKCCNNLTQKTWLPKSKLKGGEGQSKTE